MALDSKAALDRTEDIRYMSVPNGVTEHLGFYGNWYVGHGTDAHGQVTTRNYSGFLPAQT